MLAEVAARGDALAVLRGPGARKSSLPAHVARMARDRGMWVLSATPLDADADLPYSGLHRLLEPILARLDELPRSEALALEVALELAPGVPPEPFRVAFSLLSLLGATAALDPVVLIADDMHRLDRASADTLCIVARWLRPSDPVLVFLGGRAARSSILAGDALDQLKLGTFGAGPPWSNGDKPAVRQPQRPPHEQAVPHRLARRPRAVRPFGSQG